MLPGKKSVCGIKQVWRLQPCFYHDETFKRFMVKLCQKRGMWCSGKFGAIQQADL